MPMSYLCARAQSVGTVAWIIGLIGSLPFIYFFSSSSAAYASEKTEVASSEPQCQNLNLSLKSATPDNPFKQAVNRKLDKFEKAFATNDSELFSQLASKALQKEKRDLDKLFKSTVAEYGLQKAKLQRNSVWEMRTSDKPVPGQLITCGEAQISPVYGPKRQVAVFYSNFSKNNQTRLLLFLAQTPLDEKQPENLGMVLMQVQRWTYDGQSPEKIYQQSSNQEGIGNLLIARVLADAAAKILESNPYVVTPTQTAARNKAELLRQSESAQFLAFLNGGPKEESFQPEALEPIFRSGGLAVGLKVRMNKELALNTQIKLCKSFGRELFARNSPWRNEFSGFECLLYSAQEPMTQPPKAGSQYYTWQSLDSK